MPPDQPAGKAGLSFLVAMAKDALPEASQKGGGKDGLCLPFQSLPVRLMKLLNTGKDHGVVVKDWYTQQGKGLEESWRGDIQCYLFRS